MSPTIASNTSSRTSSTPAAAASLRPRAARLISGLDEDSNNEFSSELSARVASPRVSPFGSRPVSPIPSKHPSRTNPSERSRTLPSSSFATQHNIPRSTPGLWDSPWAALQGLASNVLGSDTARRSRSPSASGKRSRASSDLRRSNVAAFGEWGPAGLAASSVGGGSRKEREALVREAKRKDLLDANGHGMPDSSGRIKRRTSEDFDSGSRPPPEHEDQDTLVYVHRVQPQDTIAGITIRFNCQAAVLRKANRMWPNDPIQARKVIYLPVDVCGVKGRKVAGPDGDEEEDLLGDEDITMHESPSSSKTAGPNGWHFRNLSVQNAEHRPPLSTTSSNDDCMVPWKHDSWVVFHNEKQPVEIVRLPRRHLGFFPRARRKSNGYSELATPTTGSLDLPRIANSPKMSPSLRPSVSRTRSSSSTAFAAKLQGPGGVGTLDKNVRLPGPAPDSLNRILGPHLPSVEPPPYQTVYTPWNPGLLEDSEDLISFGSSGGAVGTSAKASMDLQELSGAVESWMRKMAKKAATAFEGSSTNVATRDTPRLRGVDSEAGTSDLIELVDSIDLAEEPSSRSVAMEPYVGSSSMKVGRSGNEGIRGRRPGRDELKVRKGD